MQYIFSSLYQLSDYLFYKKIKQFAGMSGLINNNQNNGLNNNLNYSFNDSLNNTMEISFDQYLKPLEEELGRYEKFKKIKQKEEEGMFGIVKQGNNQIKQKLKGNNKMNKNKKLSNSFQPSLSPLKKPQSQISKSLLTLQSQLIKCYQKVPYIYFQQSTFSLDFSNFSDSQNKLKYNNTQKMKQSQQTMNDYLDLIEINLFAQIHRKFQDYFKAAANFDYLRESITGQLRNLNESRSRVKKVQKDFVEKSQNLRKKIIQRTNYQKLLKKLHIIKSLKKLPSLIESILQSQFPFDCLSFLKQIKTSIIQVQSIQSIKFILNNIKSCQTIVQLGLNKRYTDELYLYVGEGVMNVFDFESRFRKITQEVNVFEKENGMGDGSVSLNLSKRFGNNQNNENEASFRDRSGIFMFDQLMAENKVSQFNGKYLLKNYIAKRQQGKQYQIAMILLQSYQYIDFPVDVTKIKITNGLRVICKKFQKQLLSHFLNQIQKAEKNKQKTLLNDLQISQQKNKQLLCRKQSLQGQNSSQKSLQQQKQLSEILQDISIQCYTKHIFILNDLFKQTLNRYLGYIMTLVTQYEELVLKNILEIQKSNRNSTKTLEATSDNKINTQNSIKQNSNHQLSSSNIRILQKSQKLSKLQQSHTKFKQILSQQLCLLPSIFKILQQKLNYFLTLKNISSSTPQQFYQWISLLKYWQKWFDTLTQESMLLNYTCSVITSQTQIGQESQLLSLGQNMVEQIIQSVLENVKKSLNTIGIKNRITELTITYLNNYGATIISELHQGILQQSWQSIEIPQEYSDVINNIICKPNEQGNNLQLTILNSSVNGSFGNSFTSNNTNTANNTSQLKSTSMQEQNQKSNNKIPFKYKILKNNILIQGHRYKLTCSFLLLSQFIQQLIRLSYLFMSITSQCDTGSYIQALTQSKHLKKIISCIYDKIYDLIQSYNKQCKQMILEKKVLKLQKIKGNNITVKHICLLSNCLTFLEKLTREIPVNEIMHVLNKKERQSEVLYNLANHNILLIDKISSILSKKIQSSISIIKQQQKAPNIQTIILQSNQSIITFFLQITQIIDDSLDYQKCQRILNKPFQLFVQKYFKMIILKGGKYMQELKVLLEKLKFLKKYFKNQFAAMEREIEE